jgi:hypothetical protein
MASRKVAGGRAQRARPPDPRKRIDFPTAAAVAEEIHAARDAYTPPPGCGQSPRCAYVHTPRAARRHSGARTRTPGGAHGAPCGAHAYAGWRAWCAMRRARVRRVARMVRHAARTRTPGGAHGAPCGAHTYAGWRARCAMRRARVRRVACTVRHAARTRTPDGAHGAPCGAHAYAGWRAWCAMRRTARVTQRAGVRRVTAVFVMRRREVRRGTPLGCGQRQRCGSVVQSRTR